MVKKKITPIVRKVNLIVSIILFIGVGALISFFVVSNIAESTSVTNYSIIQQSETIKKAVERVMLNGDGPTAQQFFEVLPGDTSSYSIALYRADGTPAFSDNTTVRKVNARLGTMNFAERTIFPVNTNPPPDNERLTKVLGPSPTPDDIFVQTRNAKVYSVVYSALINRPQCSRCHDTDHTIRGVVSISFDATATIKSRNQAILIAVMIFIFVVALLSILLVFFLRTTIIRPVRLISTVCSSVTEGNFDDRVNIKNNDEIGQLGETVNRMVAGLYERFALSKYVSSTTIKSIGDEEGRNVHLTLFFSDIRGFTAYSEKHSAKEVVGYLNLILSEQTEIIHKYQGDVDKYVGDEVFAIFEGEDSEFRACQAAVEIQEIFSRDSETRFGGLKIGIGLNSGDVIRGRIGSERRADFTVIGDNVNLTSRLCGTAKEGQILIAQTIMKKLGEKISADGPYKIQVKGKEKYLVIYLLKGVEHGND